MTLTIEFTAGDIGGQVHVRHGVNDEPAELGFDRLGMPVPLDLVRGFPYVEASVAYPGQGYLAFFGWLQVVRFTAPDGDEFLVDTAPQFQRAGARSPFLTWGVRPSMFDAPAIDQADVSWWADAFLVRSPTLLMTPVIEPVCAFRWGYSIDSERVITPRPPAPRDADEAWAEIRDGVQAAYPEWELR